MHLQLKSTSDDSHTGEEPCWLSVGRGQMAMMEKRVKNGIFIDYRLRLLHLDKCEMED